VDCTGSMQPCIDGIKAQLRTFVQNLESPKDQLLPVNWRLRVLGFRDLEHDGSDALLGLDSPLVDNAADALKQIESLVADGGGDEPESALDALWHGVSGTNWRTGCTKVVILFSDASARTALHPDTIASGAPGPDVDAVAQVCAERGVWLRIFAPACEVWNRLKIPKAVVTDVAGHDGLGALDFAEVMTLLAKTVSQASQADHGGVKTVAV